MRSFKRIAGVRAHTRGAAHTYEGSCGLPW